MIDVEIRRTEDADPVRMRLEENGETHAYLLTLVRRGDLHAVTKVPARKSAAK